MSTHTPSKTIPRLLNRGLFARNTLPVMGGFGTRCASAINHIVAYRRKCVFTKCLDLQSVSAGTLNQNDLWYGRFHAGHGATRLLGRIGLAPPDNSGAAPAACWLSLYNVDTTTTTTTAKTFQSYNTASDTPANFAYGTFAIDLEPNDTYEWTLIVDDYSRPFSLGLWESPAIPVDTSNGGTVDPQYGVGSPLTDSTHQDLHEACTDLWERNGAHLFSWSRNTTTTVTINSSSYVSLFDGTSTGGAAITVPSFHLNTLYHASLNGGVGIVFAVKGRVTSGSSGGFVLKDGANTSIAEVTSVTTTNQWWTATATLDAVVANDLYTVEVKDGGFGNVEIDAVAIYELT